MNVEDYIASGILESYVLGELSPKERENVVSMAKQHPEISKELEKIENGIEALTQKTKVQPNPVLKEQIWENLKDEEDQPPIVPLMRPKSNDFGANIIRYAAAASIVVAIITSYLAFNYYQKWRETENQLLAITDQQANVAAEYQKVTLQLEAMEEDLAIINNAQYTRISLLATDNAPGSISTVYWNKKTSELFLNIQQLNKITTAYQFQLWAIVDGKPVDAGLVPLDYDGLIAMKDTYGAQAFAITIETKGGNEVPTLSKMQVYGEVS